MAEQIAASSIGAPGFKGLNSQDSQVQLDSGFASQAMNCVIDKFGRIGSRRGWTKVNAVNTDLGSNPIQAMLEVVDPNGNHLISAGNNKLFTGTATLTQKLVRNVDNTANKVYTITGNYWQGAAIPFGEGSDALPHGYLVQAGHEPLVYHELPTAGSTNPHSHDSNTFGFQTLGDVGSLPPGYAAADFKPNCILAAYGRLWTADIVGDRQTVYFSRLLNGSEFDGGDSGSLSLGEVFPANDKIVAITAHNGFLIIFGTNNIAVYANPIDVTALTLAEFIPNIGCVARDSVVSTGTDVIFLSDSGVRSLQRLVIEKSLPFRDLSKNVRDELMQKVAGESNKVAIKAAYSPKDAFYILALPTTKEVYCFDTRTALEDGSTRVTIWNKIEPTALLVVENKDLLIGKVGYIGKYFGFLDDTATYRVAYFTTYFDLGQPTLEKILKRVSWTIVGGSGQQIVTKWGFDYADNFRSATDSLGQFSISEYNVAEYNIDEYTAGLVVARLNKQVGGTGLVVQVGFETEINQNPVSIQKMDISTKIGKLV
jgi:hypothetical protein